MKFIEVGLQGIEQGREAENGSEGGKRINSIITNQYFILTLTFDQKPVLKYEVDLINY